MNLDIVDDIMFNGLVVGQDVKNVEKNQSMNIIEPGKNQSLKQNWEKYGQLKMIPITVNNCSNVYRS